MGILYGCLFERRFRANQFIIITNFVVITSVGKTWVILVIFENRKPLKPALRGVCSLANCSAAHEETQSNQVSDFLDFVCSLFPRQSFFTFI